MKLPVLSLTRNVLIATAIGAVLGLLAGTKSENELLFSILFGGVVGAIVGSLGARPSESCDKPAD